MEQTTSNRNLNLHKLLTNYRNLPPTAQAAHSFTTFVMSHVHIARATETNRRRTGQEALDKTEHICLPTAFFLQALEIDAILFRELIKTYASIHNLGEIAPHVQNAATTQCLCFKALELLLNPPDDDNNREDALVLLRSALALLKGVAPTPQAYSELLAALKDEFHSRSQAQKKATLQLFRAFVLVGRAHDTIVDIAQEAIYSAYSEACNLGFTLYDTLFALGSGRERAAAFAESILMGDDPSDDPDDILTVLHLLMLLVPRGGGHAAGAAGAHYAILSEDDTFQQLGLAIYKALFAQGQGYAEALATIDEAEQSDIPSIQSVGEELFLATACRRIPPG